MNTQLQISDVINYLNNLRQSEKEAWRYVDELEQERKRLNEINKILVDALENADYYVPEKIGAKRLLKYALAKAKEQT